MKKVIILALSLGALVSCNNDSKPTTVQPKTFMDSVSYALGVNIGSNLSKDLVDSIDVSKMMVGIQNGLDSNGTFTLEQSKEIMKEFSQKLNDEMIAKSSIEHDAYFNELAQDKSLTTLPSGLMYKVIKEGAGAKPSLLDTVVVNYIGKFKDGKVFDQNNPAQAARIPLGAVIKGWQEGMQLMSIGSKYELYIPHNLGYQAQGNRRIPPYSPLVFEVELLDVVKATK